MKKNRDDEIFGVVVEKLNDCRSYLQKSITNGRLFINNRIERIPSFGSITLITDENKIVQSIKNNSELLNRDYPFLSSLCRSHETFLLTAAFSLTAFSPLKRK